MKPLHRYLGAGLLLGGSVFGAACGDDTGAVTEPPVVPDAGPITPTDGGPITPGTDGAVDSGPKDCFDNPQTTFEIINACTDATRITKNPTLPLLQADGGLPPLL